VGERPGIEIRVRFLHLGERRAGEFAEPMPEAVEREAVVTAVALSEVEGSPRTTAFDFAAAPEIGVEEIWGEIELRVERLRKDLWKLAVEIRNVTSYQGAAEASREQSLLRSFASTHLILGVHAGEFVSLLDPPAALADVAAACSQTGLWPVLVGDPGMRNMLLCSPIILYDYPQVAPESRGDFFDGTEIDELLTLRVLTLGDDEKREMRCDDRTRRILDRVDTLLPESHAGLHGAIRIFRPAPEEPQR
jgi:hydrogenase maturation protease